MNKRHNIKNKIVKCLKNLIKNKNILSAIILVLLLIALAQSIYGLTVDRGREVMCVSKPGMFSDYSTGLNKSAAAGFIEGYLSTALHVFKALWDSICSVFYQIMELGRAIFFWLYHPEKSLTETVTVFMKGVWNSIRYLLWGSDSSMGTIFMKFIKIEKEGLISLTGAIINSLIKLMNIIIDIINHLFKISVQKLPYITW